MSEHYTRNTLECTAWCAKCKRNTQHRVDGGRRGPCLEHKAPQFSQAQLQRMGKAARERKKQEHARLNPSLFEDQK
jgi:hypothetical protein